jgi:hypothetical protein
MITRAKILTFIFSLCLVEFILEDAYAARVIGRKRYAQGSNELNPDNTAAPPSNEVSNPAPSNSLLNPPPAPSPDEGVMEEDLINPGADSSKEIRPQKVLPPELSNSEPEPVLPPAAWDPRKPDSEQAPAQSQGARSWQDDDDGGDYGFSLGVGFGANTFSGSLALSIPINRYVGWGLGGHYMTSSSDNKKNTTYGPSVSLTARYPWRIPLTPFAGVELSYEKWARYQNDILFDDRASLISGYFVGVSIPMSKHLALDISKSWHTYLQKPPRRFDEQNRYESYGYSSVGVGLVVKF